MYYRVDYAVKEALQKLDVIRENLDRIFAVRGQRSISCVRIPNACVLRRKQAYLLIGFSVQLQFLGNLA